MHEQAKTPTLRQFQDRFPTEDSCLDHLFQVRYGGTRLPEVRPSGEI